MRFYACTTCQRSWQVGGPKDELEHLWTMMEGSLGCITPLCNGRLQRVKAHVVDFARSEIPLPAFFRALHGFGTAEGEAASFQKFRELLTTKKVVEVHAFPVGQPERVILQRLVLEDGTQLHFDVSSRGACCYYIEQAGPTCVEVFDEQSNVDNPEATAEGGDSDREEAGRASADEVYESVDASLRAIHGAAAAELSRAEPMPAVPATSEVHTSPDSWTKPSGDHSR